MNKIFAVVLLSLIILVSGCVQYGTTQQPQQTQEPSGQIGGETVAPLQVTVEITTSGFEPSAATIQAGGTVTFVNRDGDPHWPASAVHPTHTVYPGSGIEKCGTAEQANIFDACKGLAFGESFSFIFNQKGTWGYHDHLKPALTGSVTVV